MTIENSHTETYRQQRFFKKQDPCIYCLKETYIRSKDTHEPKEWVWENIFQANEKKAGTTMLTSDSIDFIAKTVTRDKSVSK